MLNCVTLMGRLTADPILKTTTTGKEVCQFSIAVDRNHTQQGDKKSDFINIVAWNSAAKFVESYFKKGSMIAVQGSIQTRNYEDKNGNKRTAFEVVAQELSFCGNKAEGGKKPPAEPQPDCDGTGYFSNASVADFEEIADDEDMPF